MKCVISKCPNDFHKKKVTVNGGRISKHRFPKEPTRRQSWVDAIKSADPTNFDGCRVDLSYALICSEHFSDDCFYHNNVGRMLLKSAVPSIFGGEAVVGSTLQQTGPGRAAPDHFSQSVAAPLSPYRSLLLASFEQQPFCAGLAEESVSAEPQMQSAAISRNLDRVPQSMASSLDRCPSKECFGPQAIPAGQSEKAFLEEPQMRNLDRCPSRNQTRVPQVVSSSLNLDRSPSISCLGSQAILAGQAEEAFSAEPLVQSAASSRNLDRSPSWAQPGDMCETRKRALRFAGDVVDDLSPEEALVLVPKMKVQILGYRKQIRALRAKVKRARLRVASVEQICAALQKQRLTTAESNKALQSFAAENALFKELAKHKPGEPYNPIIQAFAQTLHYYSPKAFRYVRRMLHNKLPCSRTIVRWYEVVDGEQGINNQAVKAVQHQANKALSEGNVLLLGMSMDEMGMRKQITWDVHKKKLNGVAYRFGNHPNGKPQHVSAAKSALFFMLTSLDGTWKIPIAYYLIDTINAATQKELILEIMKKLHAVGASVISLTFDGTRTNICTANALGCDIRSDHPLRVSFPHPCTGAPTFALLDPVHMLKLMRNTLFSQGILLTPSGPAKWQFLVQLNELQKATGLLLAPKLSDKHLNFQNSKMKVILAVQVFSQSVADALRFLMERDPHFAGCHGMVELVEVINDLFDAFNSMSDDGKGFKEPLSARNFDHLVPAFEYAEEFIRGITLEDGTPILKSKNRTGFLGFLVAIQSVQGIFKTYCVQAEFGDHEPEMDEQCHADPTNDALRPDCDDDPDDDLYESIEFLEDANDPGDEDVDEVYECIEYLDDTVNDPEGVGNIENPVEPSLSKLYMYRLSQDHVETYFGSLRTRNGCNDNPNAVQLKSAVKRLWKINHVSPPDSGNCTNFENTTSLSVDETIRTADPADSCDIIDTVPIENCDSLCSGPEWDSFNEDDIAMNAIRITANTVHRKLASKHKCETCIENDCNAAIIGIGKVCQFLFKSFAGHKLNVDLEAHHGYLTTRALNCVLSDFSHLFDDLWKCADNHKETMIYTVIELYHDEIFNEYTKHIIPFKETNRQKLTKLIHFTGN